ncbi:hypothetical protein CBR_g38620 [Chara braunii]|uniref:Uncharacterized protein n=1 Tax=Chara braunii TaxID=69332 RepID=A0A388K0R8_CHABU|nr:hypothetical protein CBR_g38620 [Chara braunii]|eukprot:GBG63553.1 hypothetical protein CBR_g38620 [Chara braunii]
MEGCDRDGRAVLSSAEKTVVAAASVAVVRRFQLERVTGRMKVTLSRGRQRLLLQRVLDAPNCVTSSEAVLQLCFAIGCGVLPRSMPRWWIRRRTGGTWEDLRLCDNATDDHFREKLRMLRRVFMEISEACAPLLQRQVTFYREPLPPEQIVAYALYRWATGESYDNNTSSFGIGRASGILVVRDVTNAFICESALGRKVDISEDEDCEVAKLRKELEDLRARSSEASSSSCEDNNRLEALRKEKEALLKARNLVSEEERLRKQIAELRSRNGQEAHGNGKHDEVLALQLQIKELNAFHTALEEKSAEVSALKS